MIAHKMFLISMFHQSAKGNVTKRIVLLEIHNYPTLDEQKEKWIL